MTCTHGDKAEQMKENCGAHCLCQDEMVVPICPDCGQGMFLVGTTAVAARIELWQCPEDKTVKIK